MLTRLRPDALFITGDLFDGTSVNLDQLAEPWAGFSAPLGTYFVTGNHEEFSSPAKYIESVQRSGIRVLHNEKIILDGLQIVGVHYGDSTHPEHFRSILKQAALDRSAASILLVHTPDRLAVAEEKGFSLQLCGHTHRGQFFPFTLLVSRIYGAYAYGLNRFRQPYGLYFLRRRHVGTAAPGRIEPGNRPDPVRMNVCNTHKLATGTEPVHTGARSASRQSGKELLDLTVSNPTWLAVSSIRSGKLSQPSPIGAGSRMRRKARDCSMRGKPSQVIMQRARRICRRP